MEPKVPNQFAGREVLARAFGAFGGAFGQQAFVAIAFDIGLHAGPVFGVDQLDDQAAERGGVLDILPRLFEDRPEHSGLAAPASLTSTSSRILR